MSTINMIEGLFSGAMADEVSAPSGEYHQTQVHMSLWENARPGMLNGIRRTL